MYCTSNPRVLIGTEQGIYSPSSGPEHFEVGTLATAERRIIACCLACSLFTHPLNISSQNRGAGMHEMGRCELYVLWECASIPVPFLF